MRKRFNYALSMKKAAQGLSARVVIDLTCTGGPWWEEDDVKKAGGAKAIRLLGVVKNVGETFAQRDTNEAEYIARKLVVSAAKGAKGQMAEAEKDLVDACDQLAKCRDGAREKILANVERFVNDALADRSASSVMTFIAAKLVRDASTEVLGGRTDQFSADVRKRVDELWAEGVEAVAQDIVKHESEQLKKRILSR